MRSKSVVVPFAISLVALPALFGLAMTIGNPAQGDSLRQALFAATVVIEVVALWKAFSARRIFSPQDSGHLTWTLILAFLAARLVAELRLVTLTFGMVDIPARLEDASQGMYFYVVVLRYIYTASDLLFVGALATAISGYKSTGLRFEILKRDYVYMGLLWALPVLTFVFRENLDLGGLLKTDNTIAAYRMVAVCVGAMIASLCIVVRRYAIQMGGGAVARVWNTVVIAGTARAASFLVLALISKWWEPGAKFIEQYLLWVFACCWLLAALYQQEILPRVAKSRQAALAAGR
ncbi:MAG TPA: hypothetical protein VE262_24815 [Blastocatellia bacterium]|nr:hypothetical protein [Blastocatellia bacterium]